MKIHPIGDHIFVRKCLNGAQEMFQGQVYHRKGNLVLCSGSGQNTNFAEILAVGPRCKHFTKDQIGKFIVCPEISNDMHRINGEDFSIRERAIAVLAVFD